MQQTKDLNPCFIHWVSSEDTTADGVAQLPSSTGWDSPAQPQGLPPCPPQPRPGQGEKREMSGFSEEIYSHFSWEFNLLKRVGVEEFSGSCCL